MQRLSEIPIQESNIKIVDYYFNVVKKGFWKYSDFIKYSYSPSTDEDSDYFRYKIMEALQMTVATAPLYINTNSKILRYVRDTLLMTPKETPMIEHPKYPKSDWEYEVKNGDTVLGYKEWVEHKIESDMTEIENEVA